MSDEQTQDTPPRRKRTKEEIQAQREAMMARRAAKAAGQPLPDEPAEAAAPAEETPASTEAAAPAEAEAPAAAEKPTAVPRPASPGQKRTKEEIQAAREAMMARRAAKAAGGGAAAKAEPAAPAQQPAAAKAAAPAKPTAAAKKAAAKKAVAKPKPAAFQRPENISRREFLNLAWLGSLALLTVQTLGVHILFLFPRFRAGEFGGIFPIGQASSVLPEKNTSPRAFNDGKFWLTNTDKGVYAIYTVCTHLGCLYAWADVTQRFECPCHGSKFSLTGKFIEGPAPRSLDRFIIIAEKPDGTVVESPADGGGIQLTGDEKLSVDTGRRVKVDGKIEV